MNFLVNIRAEAFLAKLSRAPDRLHQLILATVTKLSILVQGSVKEKLSGDVLRVKSGTLRRSINRVINDDSSAITATIGTNVKYAAVHEYGFDGDVVVKAHVRKVASLSVGKGKKQSLQGIAFVREYTRHMVVPERSYLRSTVKDYGGQIKSELKASALEALR